MKFQKYIKITSLLVVLALFLGCTQKEVEEPEHVQDVQQSESSGGTKTVLEQITKSDAEENVVIEQISSESAEDETAVTYPRPEKIKRYEPISKEDTWFLVGGVTGNRAYKVFVDPETIESKNDLVESWSKLQFEEPQTDEDGLSYNEVKISSSIDCKNKTYSYSDSKFYDGLGRLVESQSAPYEPLPIVDGTVSAKISDFVCGYQLNRPKK